MVFHRALRKYGVDKFTWKVIDSAKTIEELKEKEIYWISFLNAYIHAENSNGYNTSTGGESAEGHKQTSEHKQKIREALKENRNAIGVKNGRAKLTEESVMEIKELIKSGIQLTRISNMFNVTTETISKIKRGIRWKHVKVA